jgi:hypothetical protein
LLRLSLLCCSGFFQSTFVFCVVIIFEKNRKDNDPDNGDGIEFISVFVSRASIEKGTVGAKKTLPNQKSKERQKITIRRVFQVFKGIHFAKLQSGESVLGLK